MVLEGTLSEIALAAETSRVLTEAEFNRLYETTSPELWRYIARMTGDPSRADDVFQKTFFRFLRSRPASGDQTHAKALLYRIATNLVIDEWRQEKRERAWSMLQTAERPATVSSDVARDVRRLLALLKPQERALLWLAHAEEMSHSEIAARIGVGEKSVRVLLFRARKRFAALLKKHGLESAVMA